MRLFTRKPLYFDSASGQPVSAKVLRYMRSIQETSDINPSGLCGVHQKSRALLEDARKSIAKEIAALPRQVVFTHSGTESNALAVGGMLSKLFSEGKRDMHVITTAIEHSSVHHLLDQYASVYSFTVHFASLENGQVDIKALREMIIALKPVLISIQYVNSETGIIQDIREIARAIRHAKKQDQTIETLLHTDAAQAQYCDLHIDRLGVDFMSFSSGKIGGPRGAAALFVRDQKNIMGYLGKGSQEYGLFSGTENVLAIAGFAYAFSLARDNYEQKAKQLAELRSYLITQLQKDIPECEINQAALVDMQSPHVVSVSIPNALSEQLVIELDARGIVSSAKSACESFDGGPSHVIRALYGNVRDSWGTVRFSFDNSISKSDARYASNVLGKTIKKIRNIQSRFKII